MVSAGLAFMNHAVITRRREPICLGSGLMCRLLLAGGARVKRYCLPHTPRDDPHTLVAFQGHAADWRSTPANARDSRPLTKILAKHTAMSVERINMHTDRAASWTGRGRCATADRQVREQRGQSGGDPRKPT